MPRFVTAAAVALLLLLAAGSAAQAKDTIVLFSGKDGSGSSVQLDQAVPKLSSVDFNDTARSLYISSGNWQLCVDYHYAGKCDTFNPGLHNLSSHLDRQVSSVRPVSGSSDGGGGGSSSGSGVLLAFLDVDGGGNYLRLTSDLKNLSDYAGFNDKVSSVAIFSGSWRLCKNKDFGGSCITLTSGTYNLGQFDFDNTISSIKRN